MPNKLVHLLLGSVEFPPVEKALKEPNGLLATGGDLSTSRLINAYHNGIFPWFNVGEPILWWSPDPRAVLNPQQLHISHSMRKLIRKQPFKITLNHAFSQVIHYCAEERDEGTWIGPQFRTAFSELHELGIAHSVEVWLQEKLVGGLYGIAQGKVFCGESMFSRHDNASKCALIALCQHFIANGGELLDCQILNPHTESLGAREISRQEFLSRLRQLQQESTTSLCWQPQELTINEINSV